MGKVKYGEGGLPLCNVCDGVLFEPPSEHQCYGHAPWREEPDELDFKCYGLKCAMRRGPLGVWCGYVRVPEGHPLFGLDQMLVDAMFSGEIRPSPGNVLKVHGGLTYAQNHCATADMAKCGPDGWWFGFDCGHFGDWVPCTGGFAGCQYRGLEYAKRETRKLARQLYDLAKVKPEGAGTPTSVEPQPKRGG